MDLNFPLNEIHDAANNFLRIANNYKVFAFHGEMGAGKTTFIHALCEAIGVQEAITSPTFSLINQYRAVNGDTIFHLDLYRIKDEQEAVNAGIEDSLYSGNLCFVEWPEKAPGIFPPGTLHVYIETVDSNTRKLQINL
jgi:tRNA threonylcarbamoyladenosine biosynthesis protein TsaE